MQTKSAVFKRARYKLQKKNLNAPCHAIVLESRFHHAKKVSKRVVHAPILDRVMVNVGLAENIENAFLYLVRKDQNAPFASWLKATLLELDLVY